MEAFDLLEEDAVSSGDFRGVGGLVEVAVVDFLNAVGGEGLHAGGAGHGGGCDEADFAAAEEAAEINLGMEHEFLAAVAIVPEAFGGVKTRGEAVVGGGDDPVVMVEGGGADFAEGVFGAKAGYFGESHGVLRKGEAGHGLFLAKNGGLSSCGDWVFLSKVGRRLSERG